MPHTSRRSHRPTPSRKLHTTLSADGWTHITRSSAHPAPPQQEKSTYTQDPSLTLPLLRKEYTSVCTRYNSSSSSRSQIHNFLSRAPRITKALCLGLGGLARTQLRGRSQWQLSAFLDVVAYLESRDGDKVRTYVRDPALLPLDLEFLAELEVEVLRTDEKAVEMLDKETLVFVPFVEKRSEATYLARAEEVGVYISTSAGEGEEVFRRLEKEEGGDRWRDARKGSERLRKEFEERKWPREEGDGMAMEGLYLYVKKEEEDGADRKAREEEVPS